MDSSSDSTWWKKAQATNFYHAIIDAGSNAVRFSIFDMTPATERSFKCVYHERLALSLLDVQFSSESSERNSIPEAIIHRLNNWLKRVVGISKDFSVPSSNFTFVATQAIRGWLYRNFN